MTRSRVLYKMKGFWPGLFGVRERKSRDWFVKQKKRKGDGTFMTSSLL
jgi:hypothetical protein